jgi:hypothetical protein
MVFCIECNSWHGDYSHCPKRRLKLCEQELDDLKAEVARMRTSAEALLKADGGLNIWCMATHGHIPIGWKEYMAALDGLRKALGGPS